MNPYSSWSIVRTAPSVKPLAIYDNKIICYSKGKLVYIGFDLEYIATICNLSRPISLLSGSRTLDRIFRLSPSCAIVFNGSIYVSFRNLIFDVDLSSGLIKESLVLKNGRKALSFSILDYEDSQCIAFGEYGSNPGRDPVNIWIKSRNTDWNTFYTFPDGAIEHIHYVAYINNKTIVLTGDFGSAAAINEIKPFSNSTFNTQLLSGQKARACWIHAHQDSVYYATDTQICDNYLYKLSSDLAHVLESTPLNGSSIYSCKSDSTIFFSTTVEPGAPSGNLVKDLLETKIGAGIKSKLAFIYALTSDGNLYEVASGKKDRWPFRLGQFGSFSFPTGTMPDSLLITYATGLNKLDGKILLLAKR